MIFAEGHQQEDFVDAIWSECDAGIDVANDVFVSGEVALDNGKNMVNNINSV